MASIFTYDHDPPRVSSPWLSSTDSSQPSIPQPGNQLPTSVIGSPSSVRLADHGVTRLEAEPQEGPTEYKLHLLLRPRRNYSSSSTGSNVSGSQQHKQQPLNSPVSSDSSPNLASSSTSRQERLSTSRQQRLEQLTTQLLWRLQQSSPYHEFSTSDLVLPKLPLSSQSIESVKPAKLLAGLEQSRGALYEIGVSDDGTFVGLTKAEMDESLGNLRVMAASLGCTVKVVRMVIVGDCEWQEPSTTQSRQNDRSPQGINQHTTTRIDNPTCRHQEQLWVAEALVSPDLTPRRDLSQGESTQGSPYIPPVLRIPSTNAVAKADFQEGDDGSNEQLRITLTGPTTSGKSSLLGTLSTATLDNGRGKSRLSLLKHRHEIASGVTSSVAQELIGYSGVDVINYASGNVTSWTDIHASAKNDRLVFVSDSAGHWRYRRTIVRGLVGWAPHWYVLCISADDGKQTETPSIMDAVSTSGFGIDLAKAHLELCLKLDRPLAVIITKLDLASTSLKQTLSKILSIIKSHGRTPSIIPPDQANLVDESDLRRIPENKGKAAIREVVERMNISRDLMSIVPIIMTSAAKGTGIGSVHSLLRSLPIPPTPTAQDLVGPVLNPEQPACLFHIEDVFGLPASFETLASDIGNPQDTGVVIAGHSRFGTFSVGDKVILGPFPAEADDYESPFNKSGGRSSPGSLGTSLPYSSTSELSRIASRNTVSASMTRDEWHSASIVSLRNLRQPVHTLKAGQVGTVGIIFDLHKEGTTDGTLGHTSSKPPRVRKGLVMAIPSNHMAETGHTLQAASGFTAAFEDSDINSVTSGSLVVVYVASIRAAARVLKLVPHANNTLGRGLHEEDPDDVFGLENSMDSEETGAVFGTDGVTDVTFELMTSREWVELGSQVLVMPGGGQGLYYGSERGEKGVAGLEGFVGRVVEVVD